MDCQKGLMVRNLENVVLLYLYSYIYIYIGTAGAFK